MQQVKRAERSVDGDEIDIGGTCQHDDSALDIGMLEAYPHIRAAQVCRVVNGLRCDHMLPAVIGGLLADSFKVSGIVEPGYREFVAMHRDAVQLGDHAARILILDKVVGQRQHGAIKGEVGTEGRMLAHRVHVTGDPILVLLCASSSAGQRENSYHQSVDEAAGKHETTVFIKL